MFDIDPYATALWLRLAEVEATGESADLGDFDPAVLRRSVKRIPAITREPLATGFLKAQKLLSQAGVALVFVPEVERTRICGASRWLNDGHPIVAMTSRAKVYGYLLVHPAARAGTRSIAPEARHVPERVRKRRRRQP